MTKSGGDHIRSTDATSLRATGSNRDVAAQGRVDPASSEIRRGRAPETAKPTEQPLTTTEKTFLDVFSKPTSELAATLKTDFPGLSDNESRDIARSLGEDPVALARTAAAIREGRESPAEGLELLSKMNREAKRSFGHLLTKTRIMETES